MKNHRPVTQVLKIVLALLFGAAICAAQGTPVVLERGGSTIVLEPYAPNVIRVSLSLKKDYALAKPGYGFIASPAPASWVHERTEQGDVFRSPRLVVTVPVNRPGKPIATQVDISKFFSGSTPGARISFQTPEDRMLLQMTGWSMSVLSHKDGNTGLLHDRRPSDPPFYQVGADFVSPGDEHYYGLGQNQEGYLDHRGHRVECWHNYTATGGQSVGVPFMVTNYGYGIIWDNPSKTVVEPGFNEQTRWTSDVGDRVSYFLIAGKTFDEIYSGYRLLTGATPLLPKAAYGYIQCKQRYASQDELLAVAKGYRRRHLPADVLVVDWFYFTRMGPDGFRARPLARSGSHEPPTARHGFPNHDQRMAAIHQGFPLLRFSSEERLV